MGFDGATAQNEPIWEGWNVTRVERSIDKSAWGAGPWEDEPDLVAWTHKGVPCLVVRSPVTGSFCGYTAVTPQHIHYRRDCGKPNVECHGGLTYSGEIEGFGGEVWWFGFDTAHFGDYLPAIMGPGLGRALGLEIAGIAGRATTYKALPYVRAEVESVAVQLMRFPLRRRPKRRLEKKHLSRLRDAARKDLVRIAGSMPATALDAMARPVFARSTLRALSHYPVHMPRVPKSLRTAFESSPA